MNLIKTLLIVLLLMSVLICSELCDIRYENTDILNKLNDLSMEIDKNGCSVETSQKDGVRGDFGTSIGTFEITHYCDGELTATGTKPEPEHTIAVDKNVIPLGSTVMIDGIEYTAEDTGRDIVGNRIDIYVADRKTAIAKGRVAKEVFVN